MSIDAPIDPAAQAVLDSFDRLGDEAKRDVLSRLLGRVPDLEWPDLDGETLCQVADETFREYDREEATAGEG